MQEYLQVSFKRVIYVAIYFSQTSLTLLGSQVSYKCPLVNLFLYLIELQLIFYYMMKSKQPYE